MPPLARSRPASFAWLLYVHRNADVGSPRVTGSTRASNAAVRAGCRNSMGGRPAPARRRRPAGTPPSVSSRRPFLNRLARQASRRRHHRVSVIPDGGRLRGRPQATGTFVQKRGQRRVLGDERGLEIGVAPQRPLLDHKRASVTTNFRQGPKWTVPAGSVVLYIGAI